MRRPARIVLVGYVAALVTVVVVAPVPATAAQTPSAGHLDSRVTSVVYQANNVVRVSATWGISTMIVFDDEEKFETIAVGDTDSWDVVPTDKGNILFVKPKAKNVTTNLNVVTDKRIYYLELNDYAPADKRQVFGIRFVYPDKALDASLRKEAATRAAFPDITDLDRANLNIDYSFTGDGSLKPQMVFDDGRKTFFRFGAKVPAIFAVNADYSETLRNFRREGDYIVVDGTAAQYTLRDGNQWTCLFNLRRPDVANEGAAPLGPVHDDRAVLRHGRGNS